MQSDDIEMGSVCHFYPQVLVGYTPDPFHSRFGPDHVFEPTEDYTRLTLDTIALCAMSLRYPSSKFIVGLMCSNVL